LIVAGEFVFFLLFGTQFLELNEHITAKQNFLNNQYGIIENIYVIALLFIIYNIFVLIGVFKKIIKPIAILNESVDGYAVGKHIDIEECSDDEIGELCKSFSRLTQNIDEQQVEIYRRQKHLELAAEISGLAFWEIDLREKVFTFNDLYYNFLDTDLKAENGYIMDIPTYFERFIPSSSQKIVLESFEKIQHKDEDFTSSFEYTMRTRTGRLKEVLVNYSVVYDQHKQPYYAYGTKFDLTDIKHKEHALQELNIINNELLDEQRALLSLFDKGDSILFKWKNDEHWSVSYVSQSVKKVLGYNRDDFLNSNIAYAHTIYDEDLEQVMNEVSEAVEKNSDFFVHKPYRVFTKDGETKWVLDYTVTQKDEKGNITHFIGYIIDITELKQKEQELERAKKEAERASLAKSEFVANMSHEIRTPLNGVIGLTELALKTDLTNEQKNYLTKSIKSSKALLDIINDVLDYSKIEANRVDIEQIEFKLDHMMHELSDLFVYRAQDNNITFACEIAPKVHHMLIGDPFRIKQVLTNLIGNAIKFTKNGKISVYIDLLSESEDECQIKFCVKDTGIGISKEKQERLFKSFSQVDASNTREYGGTGLGLSISKKLVELMGGEIGVKSAEGEGSEFFFSVTLKYKPKEQFLQKHSLSEDKVLVICSDQYIAQNFIEKIQYLNVKSIESKGFNEAIKYLEHNSFEHIIVYFLSNELDELVYVNKLKPLKGDARVIVSAKYANRFDVERNIQENNLDVEAIVYKPLTASSIYDVLTGDKDKIVSVEYDTKSVKLDGKVLLVEDNEINQIVAQQNLQNYGLEVVIAQNGKEGLDKAKEQSFDMIFMDLQMPVMDGFEASKKIREFDQTTPIIALSAAVMQKDKELTKEAGMDDHLAKPIDLPELQKILQKYLKVSTHQQSNPSKSKKTTHGIISVDMDDFLERVNGNEELVKKLLIQFYENYKDIDKKLQQNDVESKEFDDTMHTLKGVSGNLSMPKLYELSKEVYENKEKSFREQKLPEVIACIQNVLKEVSGFNEEFAAQKEEVLTKEQVLETIDTYIDKLKSSSFINDDELQRLYAAVASVAPKKLQQQLKKAMDVFNYKLAKDTLEEIKGV
jgi:PAS domain S-box-containing protein